MPARVLESSHDLDDAIDLATEALDAGELVVLPTETVYGIAGRLDLPKSRERLLQLRGSGGAFTLHVGDAVDAMHFLHEPSRIASRLMHKLWPGPVTLSVQVPLDKQLELAKAHRVDPSDLYSADRIMLRCAAHGITTPVLRQTSGPVALTRISGASGYELSKSVREQLTGEVDLIIDAGPTRFGKPSTIVEVTGEEIKVTREGVYDARIINKLSRVDVLFVCSGNTCRSPMASALAAKMLAESLGTTPAKLDEAGYTIQSAGTFAVAGVRATPQAVEAVAELGGELNGHRSQPISPALINAADWIYVMGPSHLHSVLAMSPDARSRVRPMDAAGEVEDPIGSDTAAYLELARHFEELLKPAVAQWTQQK